MSGTSADGVDVAIVDISGHGPDMKAVLRHYHAHAYPAALRKAIFHLRGQQRSSLDSLARLGQDISLAYATAINDALTNAALRAADLWAIAAHGQTLFHRPPLTLQWLDPALLAARVGCRVISDFRRADCAAGGQGAPLVPFADRILFGHRSKSRVLLNLGGIANITWLPKRADPVGQPIAFDTGPANCLSDCLMRRSLGGAGYDAGGALAKKGHPIRPLAEAFLRDQYFIAVPPKSTDIPSMIAIYQRARQRLFTAGRQAVLGDELATACQVAAASIVDALGRFLPGLPDQVIASGGGTANHTLMGMLRRSLRRLARTAGHPI